MTDEYLQDDMPADDTPLDPWMLSMAREVTDVDEQAIPREMMWARIKQARMVAPLAPTTPVRAARRLSLANVAAIAAVLIGGVAVGRYLLPATGPSKYQNYQTAIAQSVTRADSINGLGLGPDAIAALPPSDDPAHVAMQEHLTQTVSLLTSVRDNDAPRGASVDLNGRARILLLTTRLLLDEPQLRDQRTQRLLQDLELVLVQIMQARSSAPETKRAPGETMRETNLLPRVRAAASASRRGDEPILGGEP